MHLSIQPQSSNHARTARQRSSGFSLTELLVVIAIIVLLVGLLLVALGKVQKRARQTQTEATMNQFANACAAFQAEHGIYPGVIPENFIAFANQPFSSTENAILHLMGGWRAYLSPIENGTPAETTYTNYLNDAGADGREFTFDNGSGIWHLIVNVRRIGEGSIINGKSYAPYFTPSPDQLNIVDGQVQADGSATADPGLPDLIDAWGQPIMYLRQVRGQGPLLGDPGGTPRPQFQLDMQTRLDGCQPYLRSPGLGEAGYAQDQLSIFGPAGPGNPVEKNSAFAAVIGHPGFYNTAAPLNGSTRGSIILISAGQDGVYFSKFDGPGDASNPITDLNVIINGGPKVIDEFDDVRVYSGG